MNERDQFIEKCKHHNLKITPQRMVIFKALMNSKEHPSAEIIHKKVKKEFSSISLDTVCRTLIIFTEIGLVHTVEGHGDPKRYDPNLECHHHFYCLDCGSLTDFYSEILDKVKVSDELEQRFKITNKRLVLNGYCEICQKQKEKEEILWQT